jgi:SAM-dependent methyltransferase
MTVRLDALLRRLPFGLRRTVRRLVFLPEDVVVGIRRRRPPMVPPRGLRDVGAGDFVAVGDEFLGHFRTVGLLPESRVLDVGCGIGRLAIPLTSYLSEGGSYAGFDVTAADVRWCQKTITRRHPRFRFLHADVRNGRYNPWGRIRPEDFVFPYEDGRFDFVFATSLFTHLLASAARRYLREISRVLAPGGRSFVTFFILDDAARAAIEHGHADFSFRHETGEARAQDPEEPEGAVAYERDWLEARYREAGLEIEHPTWRGTWTHLPGGVTYQDVVIARPIAETSPPPSAL